MERLLRVASPLGLYAEEYDVDTGYHLGNFPQAFSHLALIEAAGRINDHMPTFVIEKMARLLKERGKNGGTARVLVLGVTYKKDVADLRESSALEVVRRLHADGYQVSYHDPLIPSFEQTVART